MPLTKSTNFIGLSYTDTAGSAIGTSFATYTYATKLEDAQSIYASGTATITIPGVYRLSACIGSAAVTLATTNLFEIQILVNGSVISRYSNPGTGGASDNYTAVALPAIKRLAVNDTVVVQARSGVATTASTSAGLNQFNLEWIGN